MVGIDSNSLTFEPAPKRLNPRIRKEEAVLPVRKNGFLFGNAPRIGSEPELNSGVIRPFRSNSSGAFLQDSEISVIILYDLMNRSCFNCFVRPMSL